ncbi:hypothetical protein DFW101_3140 [Solidesulfovibrio carbinoliphilus subsp. oakridgensis]|uniref:Transmembrane protein n=1 Tax=Solidesulfovibrio carbinoliphilus subsp. oakridgensis TaxID=694327 RepID=G7Q8Q3_9BACT|nr:hypothetical protein [Solidesulfovibrio carbinoliphilus]EHJ49140.1 hypothetical protein DFW101_3140 [Solidesulfovibrio carbinoliphilus subsp. oakridgensis]
MEERRVTITFSGGAAASLGYTALVGLLSLLLVPAAWGVGAFIAWWTGRLVFADGTRAVFEGRPGRVWPLFTALVFLALLPGAAAAVASHGGRATGLQMVLALALLPLIAALKLPLYRWIIEHIRLEPGGAPRFTGRYPAYLAWAAALTLSYFTIIGWPFVAVAMVRWFCRHVRGEGYAVAFAGTGWGLLWRSLVWLVGMVLILPIPWVLRSLYAWLADNLEIVRHDAQGEFGSFSA